MILENPETGKPLIESILVNPNRAGTAQIVYFNAGGNGDYIRKIKKHPSAWWWNYFLRLGLKKNCIKILMDAFKTEHCIYAAMSDFDVATWVVTSRAAKPADNFD